MAQHVALSISHFLRLFKCLKSLLSCVPSPSLHNSCNKQSYCKDQQPSSSRSGPVMAGYSKAQGLEPWLQQVKGGVA